MAVLTSDTNKFLGWLNFDVFTLISSISANIRSILAGRNERAIEIFALRSKGETLEAVGSLYGVTRERIRQIESKVHKTFWNVYDGDSWLDRRRGNRQRNYPLLFDENLLPKSSYYKVMNF